MTLFFDPPRKYAGKYGNYRSPLTFLEGREIKTAAEWPARRHQLFETWMGLMGAWPPIIERPTMQILHTEQNDHFQKRRVRVEIAPGQTGEGWLLAPNGRGPFPAALVVFYEPETSIGRNATNPTCDFGSQLTQRGFVTLNIGTPGGDAWKPNLGGAACQPLSFHAYVAANCWHALAGLPYVRRDRIGVVGHSYGGKWALFAAALWEWFACAAVSDPGIVFDETRTNVNYWEPWYLGMEPGRTRKSGLPTADNPRTGAYKRMIDEGRDLHELHALIAPRPLLVSGGSEDPASRWTALNHLAAVNRLLGHRERVAMTYRPAHRPTPESNADLCGFFERFLA